jgi:glucokinase
VKKIFLSVDLGGTNLRLGRLTEQGEIQKIWNGAAAAVGRPEDLIAILARESRGMAAEIPGAEIRGLALGIPGLVDFRSGTVLQSPHFPLWQDVKLRDELQKQLPFPVAMDNDANQAALGEGWKGAARGWQDFILITLGTGVGGGIVTESRIFRGPFGFAGEVGHIVIDRHGPPGALGSGGTLESFCSQSGLKLQIGSLQKHQNLAPEIAGLNVESPTLPEELFALAEKGSAAARAIWEDFGRVLGCAVASLGHAFGIFRYVIAGGLAGAWDFFHSACREEALARSYASTREQIQIVRAQLGNDAGLIGGVQALRNG